MNCRLNKLFVLLALTIAVAGFIALAEPSGIEVFGYHAAHPMARLFQLLFILFIISPPLIVVMLYLIWKELKKRNEMK